MRPFARKLHGIASVPRGAAVLRLGRSRVRRVVRDSPLVLIAAATAVGSLTGTLAALLVSLSQEAHVLLFGLPQGTHLSGMTGLPVLRTLLVLMGAGILVGAMTQYLRRPKHDFVDPIEANALHGGRMSLADSTFVTAQSLVSSAGGLSLGIEGGYTQIGGAIGSRMGRLLKRRRIDMRMLVSAGAAGGIAGAFGAPFAGAAYAFELILGTYTVATLAPVVAAAVAGTIAAEGLVGHTYRIPIASWRLSGDGNILASVALGIVCGGVAIALMRGVTATEQVARASNVPRILRPVAGGLAVGIVSLLAPHILGSGHEAMALVLQSGWPIPTLLTVLVFKIAASAISLGSGFRGGLFSTSLFLGTLTGALVASLGAHLGILSQGADGLMSLVGMASFGAAVIGSPMTMALLAVEITQDLAVVAPVLLGVVAATLTVRHTFGYSFATWRFHLRGEAILGGEDIGWARETTARRLMRPDITVVPASLTVSEFRQRFVPGSVKYVVATGKDGRFAGLIDLAGLFAKRPQAEPDEQPTRLADFIGNTDAWVPPDLTIDRLLPLFDERETEMLVVLQPGDHHIIEGIITETYALKRYRLELEARRKEIFGA
ncbi:MAG: chloride channel protein [Hyphomicrobiaceae bacterium]